MKNKKDKTMVKSKKCEDLIRPLKIGEKFFNSGGESPNILASMHLSSTIPIESTIVQEACHLLARKHPTLRQCLADLNGKLYFKYMNSATTNYSVSHGNYFETVRELLSTEFDDFNGPLWRVRLLYESQDTKNSEDLKNPINKKNPQNLQDNPLDAKDAILLMVIHHAITDSTSQLAYFKDLLQIINILILKKDFSVEEENLPGPYDFSTKVNIFSRVFNFLKNIHPMCLAFATDKYSNYIMDTLKEPVKSAEPDVGYIWKKFDQAETSAFIETCKKHRVTVNSCLIGAMNLALYDIALKSGKPVDSNVITATANAVNVRRYYDKKQLNTLGLHSSILTIITKINPEKKFWTYVSGINHQMKTYLENEVPLMGEIFAKKEYVKNTKLMYKNERKTIPHYAISNMGKVSSLENDRDPVKSSNVLRFNMFGKYTSVLFVVNPNTYKNELIISISVNKKVISENNARMFLEELFHRLKSVSVQ